MMIQTNVLKDLFTVICKEELMIATEELEDYEDYMWDSQLQDDIDYD
jgi:hypothetical protein